jgi:hypothetical protein
VFGSAVRALKAQHIGPDTGQGSVVDIKLKINLLSGLSAPTSETTHRVARQFTVAKVVGNEGSDIVGGKDCFDTNCLISRCQTSSWQAPDALSAG